MWGLVLACLLAGGSCGSSGSSSGGHPGHPPPPSTLLHHTPAAVASAAAATLRCSGAGLSISVRGDSWDLRFIAAGTSSATAWAVSRPAPGCCELTATVDGTYRLQRQIRQTGGGAFKVAVSVKVI
jgi:hypothetical protein